MSKSENGKPGPGEVISEMILGFKIAEEEGRILPMEAQRKISEAQREINILALAYPDFPWEIDSTQVRSLSEKWAGMLKQNQTKTISPALKT